MKKIFTLLIIVLVFLVGCDNEEATLTEQQEQKEITSGEIVNLAEIDGKYVVTIGEDDPENKVIWVNRDNVTEEVFLKLNIGDYYTIED